MRSCGFRPGLSRGASSAVAERPRITTPRPMRAPRDEVSIQATVMGHVTLALRRELNTSSRSSQRSLSS